MGILASDVLTDLDELKSGYATCWESIPGVRPTHCIATSDTFSQEDRVNPRSDMLGSRVQGIWIDINGAMEGGKKLTNFGVFRK